MKVKSESDVAQSCPTPSTADIFFTVRATQLCEPHRAGPQGTLPNVDCEARMGGGPQGAVFPCWVLLHCDHVTKGDRLGGFQALEADGWA